MATNRGATWSLLLGAVEEPEAERVLSEHRQQFDDLRAELITKKTAKFGKTGPANGSRQEPPMTPWGLTAIWRWTPMQRQSILA